MTQARGQAASLKPARGQSTAVKPGGMGHRNYGPLKSHTAAVAAVQRLSDSALIALVYWLTHGLRPQPWTHLSTLAVLFAVVVFQPIAEVNGLYRPWRGTPIRREIQTAVIAWFMTAPILLSLAFLTKTGEEFSRISTVSCLLFVPTVLSAWRLGVRQVLIELRKRGRNTRSVAVAGCTEPAQAIIAHIESDVSTGLRLHGVYDDRSAARRTPIPDPTANFRGDLDALVEDARAGKLDIVYIGLPLRAEERIRSVLQKLADTTATVYVIAEFYGYNLLHSQWATVGEVPVVSVFDTPFDGLGGWAKRAEDLILGSLILVVISIPMLLITLVIKATSPGPVLFRQRRYGLNGKEILVLKFRSMTVCEDGDRVQQAQKGDTRVTPFGAFLRRTSLDELPQFLQVITGEMSIVGPRPHAIAHNEEYRRLIEGYMLRHKVKPGITGWAQVNGWRGETDVLEKMQTRVEHDLEYIRNWHLSLDLQIILMTIFGSKARRNAY